MKYVAKKSEARPVQEASSVFYEYTLPAEKVCIGVSVISGRYPETGFEVDEQVEGCWYVESGSGVIGIGGREYALEPGDVVSVPMNEKFYIQGTNLRLIVASSPPWTREQHKHIE
jgi:mannose-6-phosphate isomerase-like protein (cupin superfamily)